ncbi:MAG TPA: LytTR family DNA-binding domain-containing protein [Kiritimatiellia bacterium]|nr:LytTR family DNA-binding domain-containing protein [Kiritimatiellia bacterium]HMO97517.1 LytTR family DNA-binding domain-containing protein [Kiritimatiellia bacterium]
MRAVFRVGDPTPWKYFLGISIALGVLFAALGPEGTTKNGVIPALVQWLAQAIIPMALCIAAHLALHQSATFDRLNPWLKLLASGCLGAFLFAPIAYGIDLVLVEWPAPGVSHLAGWLEELGAVLVPVAFTWIAINAPFQLGYSLRREVAAVPEASLPPPSQPAPSGDPFFLGLLPATKRGEVIHMKSELHYLSVATPKGQSLILYTLRDAIRELPPGTGIQTHRSYWANLAHIKHFETDGRLATLTMSDGAKVPVSRSKVGEVKATIGRTGKS